MIKLNILTGSLPSGGRRIPLTQGQSAIVDDGDFERISQWRWHAHWCPDTKSFYAERNLKTDDGKRRTQPLHRELFGLVPGDPEQIDHLNHVTLDNRRENLQIVTNRSNAENRRDQSKYGVGIQRRGNRFIAHARIGRRRHIGIYNTQGEARKARKAFLVEVDDGPSA